jgi:protein-L-isoaspartate(D-aspartate) O-methyltransferase
VLAVGHTCAVRRPIEDPLVVAARSMGVRDERVLAAIAAVPRASFVPADLRGSADVDRPLPIGDEQVTTQPSLVAAMVEALELRGDERVLEVGTGLGYQAAILAQLAREVFTVERFATMAQVARDNLADAGIDGVEVVVGDGTRGLPDHAPYDAIIVAAAFPEVPAALAEQLRTGGKLVQPLGPGGHEIVTVFEATDSGLVESRTVVGARFVRLVGEQGFDA